MHNLSGLMRRTLAAVLCWPVMAGAAGPVVGVDWLADHRAEVTVVETSRDIENFDGIGHIPDASFVSMAEFLAEREIDGKRVQYLVPEADAFESVMRSLGVDDDDTVVIAPAGDKLYGDTTVAARLYWQMRYYGHTDVAILDGGVAAWKAAGQPMADRPDESSRAGNFRVRGPEADLLRTSEQMAELLEGDPGAVLLDNRPLEQFAGLVSKDYVNGFGHLPGARPLPFDLFVTEADGIIRWRDEEDVQRLIATMGQPGRPAVAYCNSGHVSALAWFALSEIGGADAALYDGSLHEWTMAGERELVIGR